MPVNSPFSINSFQPEDVNWQKKEGYEPGYPLPHVITFQSVIGAAWRTYYHGSHDDAIYHDPEYAIAMQRDPLVMAIIQERCKATVNRKWHIEVEDERSVAHKAVADGLRKIVNMIPHKRQLFSYMLEGAVWAGRVGCQLKYQDRVMRLPHWKTGQDVEVEVPVPVGHQPVDGDKINYTYDGVPTVQVYSPAKVPGAATALTTASRALVLMGDWRNNFIIHAHEIRDAPFWMSHRAGSIYGVGVRHTIYWLSWLKRELLASILTYAERTGMGLRIWKYQAGNDASRREVQKAAENQTDRTNLLLPVTLAPGGRPVEGVEFIESGSTVSTLLLDILRKFDDDIERYIIGQSLSSGEGAAGLGSSGIAGFVATTKDNLTEYDADNFSETLTSDMVRKMALWIYPKELVEDANPRFAYQVAKPSPAEKLAAARQVFDMGATLSEKSLLEDAGQPKVEEGEVALSLKKQQQDQMQLETQAAQAQAAMGQAPGGKPGTGEEPEEPTEDDYNDVMKELVGEGAQQAVGGAQERFQRNGTALHYLRGKPHPARRHAALVHHHLGEDAGVHLHHYLNSHQNDLRRHRAASLIRDHMEPDDQDYGELRRRILGSGPAKYDASQTRMPEIFADLVRKPKEAKRATLPHQDLAHEAIRHLGSDALEKAREVAIQASMEAVADPAKKHLDIAAKRVAKQIEELLAMKESYERDATLMIAYEDNPHPYESIFQGHASRVAAKLPEPHKSEASKMSFVPHIHWRAKKNGIDPEDLTNRAVTDLVVDPKSPHNLANFDPSKHGSLSDFFKKAVAASAYREAKESGISRERGTGTFGQEFSFVEGTDPGAKGNRGKTSLPKVVEMPRMPHSEIAMPGQTKEQRIERMLSRGDEGLYPTWRRLTDDGKIPSEEVRKIVSGLQAQGRFLDFKLPTVQLPISRVDERVAKLLDSNPGIQFGDLTRLAHIPADELRKVVADLQAQGKHTGYNVPPKNLLLQSPFSPSIKDNPEEIAKRMAVFINNNPQRDWKWVAQQAGAKLGMGRAAFSSLVDSLRSSGAIPKDALPTPPPDPRGRGRPRAYSADELDMFSFELQGLQ